MVVSVDEFRGPGNLADAAGTPAPLRSFSTHPRRRPRLTAERLTVLHARETAITCRLERMLAVALLHGAIVLFFALGWLLPWQIVHWAVTVGGLAMQACWCLLDDNCP